MVCNPIVKGSDVTDVVAGVLAHVPFVPHDFLFLCGNLPVKARLRCERARELFRYRRRSSPYGNSFLSRSHAVNYVSALFFFKQKSSSVGTPETTKRRNSKRVAGAKKAGKTEKKLERSFYEE